MGGFELVVSLPQPLEYKDWFRLSDVFLSLSLLILTLAGAVPIFIYFCLLYFSLLP